MSRCFACHRDIVAWWAIRMGRDLTFQTGEVDIDVAKHVVSRAGATENVHKGRLLVLKERSTKRRKVVTCPDVSCPKGTVPGPEANEDVEATIRGTLRDGAIACADGGRAIMSAVKKAASGAIPIAYAVHGFDGGKKQFTALTKIPKDSASQQLQHVMTTMGRLSETSSSLRVTGGNQAAEGVWGSAKSWQKGKCTHRGGAAQHATAHAACATYMAHNPGVPALAAAWKAWLSEHVDSDDPQGFFSRSGWTGKGPYANDADIVRITHGQTDAAEWNGVVLKRGAKKPRKPRQPH